jgi:hypothetical protein
VPSWAGTTVPTRKQSENNVIFWAVLTVVIAGGVLYIIHQHYWGWLILIASCALSILALAYITQVRTKCLVTFTATGLPCQNPTRGIIFGCNGQNHKWDKILTTLGRRRKLVGPHPPRGGRQKSGYSKLRAAGSAEEVIVVRIEGDVKNTILFYTTVLASLVTIFVGVDQVRKIFTPS